MENEYENDPTVSSPILQQEKPVRLYADISQDSQWFEQMAKFEALFDKFVSRFDDFAKRHGIR